MSIAKYDSDVANAGYFEYMGNNNGLRYHLWKFRQPQNENLTHT